MSFTPAETSLASQGPYAGQTWDLFAEIDGWVVTFCGEAVARAKTFDGVRKLYSESRAHAAMALESLRHTLEEEEAR